MSTDTDRLDARLSNVEGTVEQTRHTDQPRNLFTSLHQTYGHRLDTHTQRSTTLRKENVNR